jgi:hypothetical protein
MTNLTPVGSTCIAVNSNSNDLLQKLDIEDMDEGDNDFAMDGHDQDHDSMKKYTEVKFSRFILFGDDSDVEGTDEEDNNLAMDGHNYDVVNYKGISTRRIPRVTIYLRLDSLPGTCSLISLFGGNADKPAPETHRATCTGTKKKRPQAKRQAKRR